MWGSRGDKKKDKKVKKGTKLSDTVEGGGPSYSRGGAKLAEQLKHALKHQVAGSQEIRQEMKDLNAAFENEVTLRKQATAEMEQLRHQLSILNSKVMGFEQQLQDEKRKTEQLESGMPMPSSIPVASNVRASWAPPPPLRTRSIPSVDQRRASERLPPPPSVDKRRVSAVLPVPLSTPQRPIPIARNGPVPPLVGGGTPPLARSPQPLQAPPLVPPRESVASPPLERAAPPLAPPRGDAVTTGTGTTPPPVETTPPPLVTPADAAPPTFAPPREQRGPPPRPPVEQRRVSQTLPAPITALPSPTGGVKTAVAVPGVPQKHVVRGRGAVMRGGARGWSSGTLRAPRARPAPARPTVQF